MLIFSRKMWYTYLDVPNNTYILYVCTYIKSILKLDCNAIIIVWY